jgi:hypothetical protein
MIGGRKLQGENTMSCENTTTSTISVLFQADESEKMRAFERALRCERERVAAGVVALHIRRGFWSRKGGPA